ncbi:unknown [Prevotella sp. CAG:487]|nr:unknown [Prevotella sp. CAG:487]
MHAKFYEHKDIKTLELNNYSSYIYIHKNENYANKDMIVLHIGIILITRQLVYQSRELWYCCILHKK